MGQTRCLELILGTACLIAGLVPVVGGQGKKRFRDDPRAHALYDKMIETMRAATTLSWKSEYRWSSEGGREIGRCSYTCRLKKPNQFRLDTVRADGRKGGVLIGDGDNMWIHWPNGRPFYSTEDPKTRGLPRDKDYFRQRTPLARHSIAHETGYLGAGMSMTVLDASTFHGYTDSLQRYLDGVTSEGSVVMADSGEECDIILVSFMKGQRSQELWLSKKDGLPRYLEQVVRVSYDIVTEETWSEVRIDEELPPELFSWTPPAGYKRWFKPKARDRLLRPGTLAPDFELSTQSGEKLRLSSLRGRVVWLNFWRVG